MQTEMTPITVNRGRGRPRKLVPVVEEVEEPISDSTTASSASTVAPVDEDSRDDLSSTAIPSPEQLAINFAMSREMSFTVEEKIDLDRLRLCVDVSPKIPAVLKDKIDKEQKRILTEIHKKLIKGNISLITYVNPKGLSSCCEFDIPNVGRLTPSAGVGLTCLKSSVRSFVAEKNYVDVDMVGAHQAIAKVLFKRLEVDGCEILDHYCKVREDVFSELMKADPFKYRTRKDAKAALLSLMFDFGTGGVKKCNDMATIVPVDVFDIKKYYGVLEYGAKALCEVEEWKKIADACAAARKSSYDNSLGTAFAGIIQTFERSLLLHLRDALILLKRKPATLIYDGLFVEKKFDDEKVLDAKSIDFCEKYIREKSGFDIKLSSQPLASDLIDAFDDVMQEARDREEDTTVNVRCHGVFDRSQLFSFDGVNKSMLQAIEEWLHHLHEAGLVLPMRHTKSIYSRVEGNNLWSDDVSTFKYICYRYADRIVKEEIGKDGKKTGAAVPILNHTNQTETIIKTALDLTVGLRKGIRSTIDILTEQNFGKVFYTNGYYDLKKRRFVTVAEDPLASTFVRVERPFYDATEWNSLSESHPDVVAVREKYCTVFGSLEEQNYALRIYADAIGGKLNKYWTVNHGPRNCGKGTFEKCIKTIFGDKYVGEFSAPTLRLNAPSDPAAGLRELITRDLHLARIAFSNESSQVAPRFGESPSLKLDGLFLKAAASGGDDVVCRNLFKGEESVRVTAKLFMNTNHLPEVFPPDALETCILVSFPNKYEGRGKNATGLRTLIKSDDDIKQKFFENERYHMALTWIIFNLWKTESVKPIVCSDDGTVPFSAKTAFESGFGTQISKQTCLYSIFGRRFETGTHTDYVPISDVKEIFYREEHSKSETDKIPDLKTNHKPYEKYNCFLENQKGQFTKDKVRVNGKPVHVWRGLRLKQTKPEITSDED